MTHSGTSKVSISPEVTRARVMMPIVFWASWVPCPNAIAAELSDLRVAEAAVGLVRVARCRNAHRIASMNR